MSKNNFNCYSLMAHFQMTYSLCFILISVLLISHQFNCIQAIKNNNSNNNNNKSYKKEINRRSIVFDIKTPKVFYCPQEKQSDVAKMIVKAKPLDKLCEFEGKMKPKNLPSDCYNDVDETEFACDEKKRFLLRLDADQDVTTTTPLEADLDNESEYIFAKDSGKKKVSKTDKKY